MTRADRHKVLRECDTLVARALTLAYRAGSELTGVWLAQARASIAAEIAEEVGDEDED